MTDWLLLRVGGALGGVMIIGLAISLIAARADARHWHKQADQYRVQLVMLHDEAQEATLAAQKQVKQAEAAYDARVAALQPVVEHSRTEVIRYAQTPAGRTVCASAERVRALDALDASLLHPAAPASSPSPVPANTSTSPTGR